METDGRLLSLAARNINDEALIKLEFNPNEIDRRLVVALSLLNQWKDRKDPVHNVADHLRISNSHLRQLFKKHLRISPGRYLKLVRLQSARLLINDTYLSIKEVVGQVGYGDVSHFVRDFKVQYGMTPSQVRTLPMKTPQKAAAVPPTNPRFG
jgi:transcriptional regulator GlxA family with amidase domain